MKKALNITWIVAVASLPVLHACAQTSAPPSVSCSEYYPITEQEKIVRTTFLISEDGEVALNRIVLHEMEYTKDENRTINERQAVGYNITRSETTLYELKKQDILLEWFTSGMHAVYNVSDKVFFYCEPETPDLVMMAEEVYHLRSEYIGDVTYFNNYTFEIWDEPEYKRHWEPSGRYNVKPIVGASMADEYFYQYWVENSLATLFSNSFMRSQTPEPIFRKAHFFTVDGSMDVLGKQYDNLLVTRDTAFHDDGTIGITTTYFAKGIGEILSYDLQGQNLTISHRIFEQLPTTEELQAFSKDDLADYLGHDPFEHEKRQEITREQVFEAGVAQLVGEIDPNLFGTWVSTFKTATGWHTSTYTFTDNGIYTSTHSAFSSIYRGVWRYDGTHLHTMTDVRELHGHFEETVPYKREVTISVDPDFGRLWLGPSMRYYKVDPSKIKQFEREYQRKKR